MAVRRRVFSRNFKLQVIREIEAGKTQAQVSREHQLNQHVLSRWYREHRKHKERAFPGKSWAAILRQPALLNSSAWSDD